MDEKLHQSVLLSEAVEGLLLEEDDVVVDATIGGAGHFSSIMKYLGTSGTLIGIDADHEAIVRGQEAAKGARAKVHVVEGNFRAMGSMLDGLGIETIDKALFDLGWSSYHLSAGRGFSFRADEPLHMTYGEPTAGNTAADMVNTASEEALADLFYSLGDERFSRPIARAIVARRASAPLRTTNDLVDAVMAGTPGWYQHRRIHPATKVFQALRIAVNDELGALRDGLSAALTRLSGGGRVAIISFHSIEDRIVKTMLRDAAHEGLGQIITKKPVVPTFAETKQNPRARSAKLRIFEKVATGSSVAKELSTYSYA